MRPGTYNPSSAKQFGQRRDSNGTKARQTGQANARTDSIVAVRTGRPHRFSRYRGECRNVIGQTSPGRRTAGAIPSVARPYRRGALPQPWLPNGAGCSSPRRRPGDWGRFLAVPEPHWQRADSLLSRRFDASERTISPGRAREIGTHNPLVRVRAPPAPRQSAFFKITFVGYPFITVFSDGAVREIGDVSVDASARHVAVLGHRHLRMAGVVGADTG